MGLYSTGAILPFPLELYSPGVKNHAFSLGLSLNIEHSLNSQVLFSESHILYLEAITHGCSLKYMFFKTQQTIHTEKR